MITTDPFFNAPDMTYSNIIGILERHAGRMLRIGGGIGYRSEQLNHGEPVTEQEKARICELGRTRLHTPMQIAAMVGRSDTTVWRVLKRAGIESLDLRRGADRRRANKRRAVG